MSTNGGGIKYIKHQDIDYKKWDHCIENAGNSRVYAMSWHLDRTAGIWDALVWGDYDVVMPLPVRKKWGIKYLYQPFYCQQLGIFPNPSADIAMEFYNVVARKFSYFDIQINSANLPPENPGQVQFFPRKNFLLSLNTDYVAISSGYSKNTHRNIAKASNHRLGFVEGITLEEYIGFVQKNQTLKTDKVQFQKLKSIIAFAQYKGFGEIVGVYSIRNQLCAAVFFCRWKNRIIYLNPVSSNEGKRLRAMFFLIDKMIENNAGKIFQIDFEGSMVPGIARFFEGFGAAPETYYRMKSNRLPVPLRWIKKN